MLFLFLAFSLLIRLQSTWADDVAQPLFAILPDSIDNIRDCKASKIISCRLIQVDFQLIQSQSSILIPDLGITLQFHSTEIESHNAMAFDYLNAAGDTAHLSIAKSGRRLHASIKHGGRLFEITYVGGNKTGKHVFIEDDVTKFIDGPGGHHAPDPELREMGLVHERERAAANKATARAASGTAYVTIKVYYTAAVAASVTNIQGVVDLAISETNTGYRNSGVDVVLSLRCIERSTAPDGFDLSAFAASKGSYAALRGSADVAVLLVNDATYCGIAYLSSFSFGGTIGIVNRGCATGYYSFGHEIAHMFGAMHNREVVSGSTSGYNYGLLIKTATNQPSGKRTILAYADASNQYPTRINYYSSATNTAFGLKLGDSVTDNSRVLNENRGSMSAVGDEKLTC